MYVRRDVSARLRPLKLITVEDVPPYNFETGTLNHEGMAGTVAATDFIADLGRWHEAGVSPAPEGAARLAGPERPAAADRRRHARRRGL